MGTKRNSAIISQAFTDKGSWIFRVRVRAVRACARARVAFMAYSSLLVTGGLKAGPLKAGKDALKTCRRCDIGVGCTVAAEQHLARRVARSNSTRVTCGRLRAPLHCTRAAFESCAESVGDGTKGIRISPPVLPAALCANKRVPLFLTNGFANCLGIKERARLAIPSKSAFTDRLRARPQSAPSAENERLCL